MTDASLSAFLHIFTRKQAISNGFRHYFTGKPCKRGHYSLRMVSGKCLACEPVHAPSKERRAAQGARYYLKHKDRLLEQQRNKYRASSEAKKASSNRWRLANPDRKREANRAHYLANKERYRKRGAEWAENNQERMREAAKKWRQENAERVRASKRNRKALLRKAEGLHTEEDIQRLMVLQRSKCAHCSRSIKKERHVDHVIPIARGGSNWPDNLQLLCPHCNMSKGAKDPYEWKQERGMLL